MRLFIAIRLDDKMKKAAAEVQARFRAAHIRGNYTPAENMHLTLAFIGEYNDPDQVLETIESISFRPFTITMDQVGCFGDLWWTGFAGSDALEALVRKLRRALAEEQIPFDRKKFRPHVTILRKADYAKGIGIPQIERNPVSMRVDRIALMRSDRGKNGMIYTEYK